MTPSWVIIAVPAGTFAVCVTVRAAFLALRRRSRDRAWAAGIASRVHDGAYLRWLEGEFKAMDAPLKTRSDEGEPA